MTIPNPHPLTEGRVGLHKPDCQEMVDRQPTYKTHNNSNRVMMVVGLLVELGVKHQGYLPSHFHPLWAHPWTSWDHPLEWCHLLVSLLWKTLSHFHISEQSMLPWKYWYLFIWRGLTLLKAPTQSGQKKKKVYDSVYTLLLLCTCRRYA